jgi:O-antigen/teichoic acid export membrane protein
MPERSKIVKQAGIYTFSSQIAQAITLVAAILSRRFLGPIQMGVWAMLQIIVEYSAYTTLGTMHSVLREIPYHMGKGDHKTAEAIKNAAFTIILSVSSVAAFCIFGIAALRKESMKWELAYGLMAVAFIVVLQRFNDFLIQLLRCYKQLSLAAKQMIASALVNALLVSLLAYRFKIYGFMLAIFLSLLFNIIFIRSHTNFHLRFQFAWDRFTALVRFGFPLMIIGIMTTTLRSIDRIMIVRSLGFEALGFYSIALMVGSYISNFISSFAIVYIPHFQEKIGLRDEPHDLKNMLFKTSDAYALIMPAVIGGAWIIAPYLIYLMLPKFVPGIIAMKFFSLGIFFTALIQSHQDFLIAIKRHLFLLPFLALSALIAMGLNYTVIRNGWGIAGVACATSILAFINFSVVYFVAVRFIMTTAVALVRYLTYFMYAAYLILALLFINQYVCARAEASLWATVVKSVTFLAFYSPFVILLEKKLSFLSYLWKRVRSFKPFYAGML